MFGENKKIINSWYIISFLMITIGVIIGAVYYSYNFLKTVDTKNYLDSYLNSLRNGMNFLDIVKTSLKSYAALFLCIIIASYFKLGFLITIFLLIRKGFISAFTTAAMIDVYNLGGLALAGASGVQIVIFVPVFALFSAVSVFYSKNRKSFEKREKIIYIIFCIIIFTIFCGCAVFEGLLTTTFMKWLAYKVT